MTDFLKMRHARVKCRSSSNIRYFLKLGFLDGLPRSRKLDYPLALLGPQNKFFGGYGFRWHFWQGLWYHWLVDKEIGKLLLGKQV